MTPASVTADPRLNALATACRRWPRAEKWVILPSLAEGLTLGDRLADSGVAWANLRFTTPRTLARQLAGMALAAEGWRSLPWGGGPALVARVLADLPPEVPRYFRDQAGHGPAEALWRTIQEVRLAGVSAAAVGEALASTPPKAAEITALLGAIDHELGRWRLADTAITLQRATEEASRWAGSRTLLIASRYPWTPLERRLLEAIPGERHPLPDLDLPGVAAAEPAPRRLAGTAGAPPLPEAPLAWLLAPDVAPAKAPRARIKVVRAAGHEAEIDAAVAALLGSGLGADRFEFACAQEQPYLAAIRDTCERLGLEVTLGPGLPARQTRPGRLLLALARWGLGDFPASTLRAILLSGDLDLEAAESSAMAHHLAAAGAGWTRATYRSTLSALARYYRGAYGPDDETPPARQELAREVERTLATIESWLDRFPAPDTAGRVGVVAFTAALEGFLKRARTGSDLDARARVSLRERLAALRETSLPGGDAPAGTGDRLPAPALLARIEDLLAGPLGAGRPRPGALHVSALRDAGLSGRERLLVLGFDQAAAPRPLIQDPVLLDRERERLSRLTGTTLATAADRTREQQYRILARLASSTAEITLSYSFRDTRDNRAAFAHRLLLQAQRLAADQPDLSYEAMERGIPAVTPVPAPPGEAVDELRWWLAALRDLPANGKDAVLAAFPILTRGAVRGERLARFLDASQPPPGEPDERDGLIPEAVAEDPRVSGRPISPTALSTLAACRRRYLFDKVLGVDPTTTRERDPAVWLDPLQRGSLLHAFYERVHRQGIASEAPARALFDELLAELRAASPPPGPGSEALETAELWEDALLFVVNHGGAPAVEAEVAFGMDRPLFIPTSTGPLPVRGQIDRLDDRGGGRFRVVDYKTGRYPGGGQFAKRLKKGAYLQHLIYPLALAALRRGARAEEFAYVFPTRVGENEAFTWQPDPARDLAEVEEWLSRLAGGLFLPAEEEATCAFCDYRAACEAAPWLAGARMKGLRVDGAGGQNK